MLTHYKFEFFIHLFRLDVVLTGNISVVCCLRYHGSQQCLGRPESFRLSCLVQSSTFPHVHVPNACRCLRPGKLSFLLQVDLRNCYE